MSMCIMFKCLQMIICAKYCCLGYVFKNAPGCIWCICLIQRQNLRYFRCPV